MNSRDEATKTKALKPRCVCACVCVCVSPSMWRMLFLVWCLALCRVAHPAPCGGELVNQRGILQTPGFPGEFPVPIRCHWIIKATNYNPDNVTIVVYLTQLFVTTGLTFTELPDVSFDMGSRVIHQVTEKNVTVASWVMTPMQYLKVDFVLDRLEGNHLRVLEDLIDVYGFNLTYEIRGREEKARPDSCTATACSFAGNCLANHDFTQYGCSCFKGFSGPNCGQGPLCQSDKSVCQNGAVCRVVGSGGYICKCPTGVSGLRCEHAPSSLQDLECAESGCSSQCPYVSGRDGVCNCPKGPRIPTDRARYEGTVRLANLSWVRDAKQLSSLQTSFHKQITRFLRSSHLSRMEELRVLNITPGAEVSFHFFGGKLDGGKVRDALNRLVERGRLGNLSLVATHLAFKQEPTLLLQAVKVNQEGNLIREDDEFILSCVAQGSSYMTFRWFKDGVVINESRALRTVWTKQLPVNTHDQHTSLLGVDQASILDEGVYTCQVVDWGMQQCKSIHLEVWSKPVVAVYPMSVTIERGKRVNIKCMSSKDGRHEKLGYNWTKNKALFKMAPGHEVWEDLSPTGSILKIYNAQKSAVYTCLVHGSLATRTVDVHVEVVNRTVIPLCPEEVWLEVRWPETAPALEAIEKCPAGQAGFARRRCSLRDTRRPAWHLPDYSDCTSEHLQDILNNFVALTLGYQNTSTLEILKDCLRYLRTPRKTYPGDGEPTVTLLKDIQEFSNRTGSRGEILNSSASFFHIVNMLLEREASIINQEKVVELQEVVKVEALLWGSALTSPGSEHLELSSLLVDVYLMDSTLINDLRFPMTTVSYPAWFSDKISIHMQASSSESFGNRTFSVAVVAYRNLSRLLPMRYLAKLNDGNELEYEINSRLITVEFNHDTQRISPGPGAFWVEIEFDHSVKDYGASAWNVTCGVTHTASFTHTWNFETCRTRNVSPNVTVCGCSQPGTYAVFLTTNLRPPLLVQPPGFNMVVVVGCACCLVQTILTLLLLLPYWWHHRNCLIFLKLQCCTATSGAMGVFIYAVRDTVPKSSYPYVTTSLEAFLLIGMSSHLSKLLIVYTEVVQIPRIKHLRQTVVCIITVVPVLAVLCNHLAHDSTGWHLQSWWLVFGTMLFNIFATSAAVMLLLFVFLYFSVMRRLRLLTGKQEEMNRAIGRRVGLLRRAGFIYCVMVIMVASSIVYINVQDSTYHYIFSVSSALMGFTIFLCYILKSEAPLHIQVLRKLKLDSTPDTEFSSESANSPLRFFTKQEGETESDAAPPRPDATNTATVRRCREVRVNPVGHSDLEEGEGSALFPGDRAPSTVETYVPSTENSAEEMAASLFQGDTTSLVGAEDVDLEDYNNSPRKYTQMRCRNPQMYSEYVEQEIGPPRADQALLGPGDQWQFVRGYYQNNGVVADAGASLAVIKPEPGESFIRETPLTSASEVVTTRVCVELGVITSRPYRDGEDMTLTVDTPAIVLCSVDVEPYHHTVLELSDTSAAVDTSARSSSSGVSSTGTQDDSVALIETPAVAAEATENAEDGDDERRQPEGRVAEGINMDGMMDRISHDLDYLLNRKQQSAKSDNTLAAPSFARKTSKPPSSSVRCQIQEEEEDEGMGLSESFTSNSSL